MTLGQVHRFAARRLQVLAPCLRRIENQIISGQPSTQPAQPILFIIGAPRSGTTLAFQSLSHALDVIYPSHLATLFPLTPAFGLWLNDWVYSTRPHHSFRSKLGFSLGDGFRGPNEWEVLFRERILPQFESVTHSRPNLSAFPCLDRIAKYMHRVSNKPLVLKVPLAVLHINFLQELLPTSRFLFMRRAPLDVARSIYRAKRSEGKDPNIIWYIRPPGLQHQKFPTEAHQIVAQVREIDRVIVESFARLNDARRESLQYEQLCLSPTTEIERIRNWLGPGARKQCGASLPSFTPSQSVPLGDAALDEILQNELG